MINSYKIVYGGSLKAGTDPDHFVKQFMQLFKSPEANARKLVTVGHAVVLKTRLDREQADRLCAAMQALGMEVHVELMGGESHPATPAAGAEGQEAGDLGPRCPKCGSNRVSGDDCLACGVIISRFKERQARQSAEAAAVNPYAPPASDVTTEEEVAFGEPRSVEAGNGWRWITDGWGHVRQNPGPWIGTTLVWILLLFAMGAVPLVGQLVAQVLGPVFTAGFMLGANAQREGEDFKVGHLFAGFSDHFGPLAILGLLYLAGMIAIVLVAAAIFGGTVFALAGGSLDPETLDLETMVLPLLGAVALMVALSVPLLMAYWFAPALVALGGLAPFAAAKASFKACARNMGPFLLYGLVLFLLLIIAVIPFFLGLLLLLPVITASIFTAYRDIFYRPSAA